MARTKEVVEKHLNVATESLKSYIAGLSKEQQDKKALHKNPKWRQLNAAKKKLSRQITFIDRRNKKPEAKAEG